MATDQLEIIGAYGDIDFYNLDPAKGLTNIGRHPENDIVIDDPTIAPFHAMLDHRQKPYQLLLLSPEGQTRLRGQVLTPNGAVPLQNLDEIELGRYRLILVEHHNGRAETGALPAPVPVATPYPPSPPTAPVSPYEAPPPPAPRPPAPRPRTEPAALPARPAAIPRPASRPEPVPGPVSSVPTGPTAARPIPSGSAGAPPPTAAGLFTSLPADHLDDVIISDLSAKEWTISVEQTAAFEVTISNGGHIVAAFAISVEGIDPDWITISEPYLNLNEGERTTVTVYITPPRLPTSYAGPHYLAVVVTSSNHPNRYSQHGATLTINPFYEFGVGELSPKQQVISWFKRSGQTNMTIFNRGNSHAPFRVEGSDDERACSFEFQVPGEEVAQAAQAELRLPPEQGVAVPVRITPHSRRLFGFRRRNYAFTVTTMLLEGEQTPRSQLGQLGHKPLFGIWQMLLMTLLLLVLIVYFFRPVTYTLTADPQTVQAGEEVLLRWRASPFAGLRITGGNIGAVDGPSGEMVVTPQENTTYELRGENWLTWLSSGYFSYTEQAAVIVEPIRPVIRVFQPDATEVFTGEEVNLTWQVEFAEEIILTVNGAPETLTEPAGSQSYPLQNTTTFILAASNQFGDVTESIEVRVSQPPVPTPFVKKFTVDKQVIVAGESIVLDWEVEGADRVELIPIGDVPPIQSLSRAPPQSLEYVLVATNGEARSQPIIRQVIVNTPTPGPTATPLPEAPVIEFFTASPDELIKGQEEDIALAWSVIGNTTNIEISGPSVGVISGLNPQGSISVTADEATLFVLTAFNGSLSASQTVQVADEDPTPTPEPPPPTATPFPPANIIFFKAESGEEPPKPEEVVQISENSYEVVVGSRVKLSWSVQNATKVTLEDFGSQPFEGSVTFIVRNSDTYQLAALNEANQETSAFLEIKAKPLPPPPSPNSFIGQENLNGAPVITLTWKYPGAAQDDITGFRIYRADLSDPDNFSRIADEGDLEPTANQFVDTTASPACGKVYYVVAVFLNLDNEPEETDSSTTSWISIPCPP